MQAIKIPLSYTFQHIRIWNCNYIMHMCFSVHFCKMYFTIRRASPFLMQCKSYKLACSFKARLKHQKFYTDWSVPK